MNIAVLGAGMVGKTIALDLAKDFSVSSFDLSEANLGAIQEKDKSIKTVKADLSNYAAYAEWLLPYDLVVTAVPGFMGYHTLEAVMLAGKNVVDISFFAEDALLLQELAVRKNVTVITDCGVAPGMSNFIIGYYNAIMKIDSFACYVGGLPSHPVMPFKYKAPFSPIDVIEEYTRPARLQENGEIITRPALSEREILSFDKIGELEAFNTDGLRSLLFTMNHIRDMKEKTLRYPGHIDLIVALQQAGFFATESVTIDGKQIRPIDFTTKLLLSEWKLLPDEKEFTIMKVIIKGEGQEIVYELYDEYDEATKSSSMSRTTGYTCTAAVHLIAKNLFEEKGVFPPELVGYKKDCFDFVLKHLQQRGVNWVKQN